MKIGKILQWDSGAWNDYCLWQADKQTIKRIKALIKDTLRNPHEVLGKPEPLKHELRGLWSRRIIKTDRLLYLVTVVAVIILVCKGHYN